MIISASTHCSSILWYLVPGICFHPPSGIFCCFCVFFRLREQLPDVEGILIDQLVHHGMEHDDETVRLWSTLASSQLLVGLCCGGIAGFNRRQTPSGPIYSLEKREKCAAVNRSSWFERAVRIGKLWLFLLAIPTHYELRIDKL